MLDWVICKLVVDWVICKLVAISGRSVFNCVISDDIISKHDH